MNKILLVNIDKPGQTSIEKYRERGGYAALEKTLKMEQTAVIDEVKASGLRGRGGAGFPTGMKWGFVPRNTGKPTYLLCNADESEPGTFKDRLLMERDPHLMIEGMAIACYALNCHLSYIYIRGEYEFVARTVEKALDEAYAAGILGASVLGRDFSLDIFLHLGQGAYICGEETSLIESLEGYRGYPRIKPPFPATSGFLASPTVVNNVETLCALPWIITKGAAAHAAIGTEKSKGTKLFSVSGHVNKPGVYEVDLGYPLLDFIENEAGGIADGRKLKAVIPGGSSVPVLSESECEGVLLDYESLLKAGSMLGSGGMIVLDDRTKMPEVLSVIADFYAHESCGQCTPCREGTGWAAKILRNMIAGKGKPADIDLLLKIADMMEGKTICPLADADVMPIRSFVTKFRHEFEALCSQGEEIRELR
ncbi:MAG TPA: NADH-quinone oxidoreductase subunit NuoF [Blastocatellia bacterium]|jgi:NADH-quinone oxidoreductase subunit F|nr:NADH-quinone oxidoreductase subunit NuoF [Blastocatellia bacterium]